MKGQHLPSGRRCKELSKGRLVFPWNDVEIAMPVLHEGEISGVPEIMSASINTWESLDGVCSGGMDNLV